MVIEGGCVSVAMYCLIQFYWQLKGDLAEHQPLLKVAAIKLVIFLSFWQTVRLPTQNEVIFLFSDSGSVDYYIIFDIFRCHQTILTDSNTRYKDWYPISLAMH